MATKISNKIDAKLVNFGNNLPHLVRKRLLRNGVFPTEKDVDDALAYATAKAANAVSDFLDARQGLTKF